MKAQMRHLVCNGTGSATLPLSSPRRPAPHVTHTPTLSTPRNLAGSGRGGADDNMSVAGSKISGVSTCTGYTAYSVGVGGGGGSVGVNYSTQGSGGDGVASSLAALNMHDSSRGCAVSLLRPTKYVAVCCSVLHCVALCCTVLHCVALCCTMLNVVGCSERA